MPNTNIATRLQNAVRRAPVATSPLVLASPRLKSFPKHAIALWSICSTTLASAYGHWKTRIGVKSRTVVFGPAFRRLPDGSLLPEERTIARSKCIDNLLAIHPWADLVDVQIFLEGFDAGEQWCRHTFGLDSEAEKHAEAQ